MGAVCPAVTPVDRAGPPADPVATPAPGAAREAAAHPAIASAAIVLIPGRLPGSQRDLFICAP